MVDFAKYKKKEEIQEEKKIEFSEEDLAIANFGKTIKKEKTEEIMQKPIITPEPMTQEIKIKQTTGNIDDKINSIVNERIIKLVKIGLKHELNIENMKQYFKEIGKSKLYELKRYFSDSKLSDISEMLEFLYKNKTLIRDKNGWFSIKI